MIRVRSVLTGVAGAPYYTNHYFDAGGLGGQEQDAVDAVGDFWNAFDTSLDNALQINTDPEVPTINAVTGAITSSVATTPFFNQFASTGEALPPATQLLIRWTTPTFVSGRRLRGRTFIPGCTEDSNTSTGTPAAGFSTPVNAAVAALTGGAVALCIWSRTHGVAIPVSSGTYWSQWAILRSRRD